MTRKEFVQYTVANTIGTYLHRYCAPWTTAQAQEKCLADAERLADQVYGVIDAPVARTTAKALPARSSSSAKRRKLPPAVIDVQPDTDDTSQNSDAPPDNNSAIVGGESATDALKRIIPGGRT